MARTRDWCKLDQNWAGNRKVRRVLRKFGPVAGAYWTLLIARSYAASHHEDNPTGVIRCTVADLAEALSDQRDRPAMWDAFVAAKLIRVKGGDIADPETDVEIELVDFSQWQWPKGSSAQRVAAHRDSEKSRDLQVSVTSGNDLERVVTVCAQNESKKEKKNKEKKTSADPAEVAIFDHWVKATKKTAAAKLTTKRLEKIREARSKFADEQIRLAISFQAANAYRDEKGVVHNDLELFLRDEDRIQKKIEAANDGGLTGLFDGGSDYRALTLAKSAAHNRGNV